jgi:pimeloyl-ACP methyl ester carboxylesterase
MLRLPARNPACALCAAALTALLAWPAAARGQHRKDFTTPTPLPSGSTLIVGFLGGIERWTDQNRPVVQLAGRLRALELPGVYVEEAEHAHRGEVLKLIEAAAGRDSKGRCTADGCREIRILLYGHSMGGAAVVKLARELKKRELPVALTVQVDSVGATDAVIPDNVARAANLYQRDSWMLHGRTQIRAEDPAKTKILANLRYTYDGKWVDLSEATLPEQMMRSRHTEMEYDPQVWNRVEDYILDELHRAGIPGAPAPPH